MISSTYQVNVQGHTGHFPSKQNVGGKGTATDPRQQWHFKNASVWYQCKIPAEMISDKKKVITKL